MNKHKKVIIFDIDGTLADISHRVHFIEGEKKDWESFYEKMEDDKPIEAGLTLMNALFSYGHYVDKNIEIVFCTGRPEKYRHQTSEWLYNNVRFLPFMRQANLLMRIDGDHRSDVEVKKEMLDCIRKTGYEVIMAIEDRKRVVDMWRENGVPCFQCAQGEF